MYSFDSRSCVVIIPQYGYTGRIHFKDKDGNIKIRPEALEGLVQDPAPINHITFNENTRSLKMDLSNGESCEINVFDRVVVEFNVIESKYHLPKISLSCISFGKTKIELETQKQNEIMDMLALHDTEQSNEVKNDNSLYQLYSSFRDLRLSNLNEPQNMKVKKHCTSIGRRKFKYVLIYFLIVSEANLFASSEIYSKAKEQEATNFAAQKKEYTGPSNWRKDDSNNAESAAKRAEDEVKKKVVKRIKVRKRIVMKKKKKN